jgi:uncharacterized lipoprotein NlpE involved in copper resistance
MKLVKLVGSCIVIVSSTGMWPRPASAQNSQVTPQEIQSSWVGKTMVGTIGGGAAAGKPIEFTMNSDGTATLSGAVVDTGTWRMSEQGYCATWKKVRSGQERCFTVIRKGFDQQVNNPDGTLSTTIVEIR